MAGANWSQWFLSEHFASQLFPRYLDYSQESLKLDAETEEAEEKGAQNNNAQRRNPWCGRCGGGIINFNGVSLAVASNGLPLSLSLSLSLSL